MIKKRPARPPQLPDLLSEIRKCLDQGKYLPRNHARERQEERNIELVDVKFVLKNGYHEKRKTTFSEEFNTWKYAIRGRTLDEVDIRVIVAFDENIMHIITVMTIN